MPDKYAIQAAAQSLLRLMREADEATLNAAYQRLATQANESEWGQTHEPLQGICLAFQCEFRRRTYAADGARNG